MGTGSSSKTSDTGNDEDVRNRLNSGDFQKISPPSSPSIEAKIDEMSYSGILVEKPEPEFPASPAVPTSAMSASFFADLTTPPISNRSKNKTKTGSKDQPRRIVKATPPSSKVVVSMDDKRNDNQSEDSDAGEHHPTVLASPIGANAANEMLEESIVKNDSKTKRLERVTNKQKSDREKLLQEKRRRQQSDHDTKPKVQANPFSRFLSAFSVNTNPTHKRKESVDAGADRNKRLKYDFNDSSTTSNIEPEPADKSKPEDVESTEPFSWIAAVSIAAVAVLVIAIVRSKKK